MADIIQFPVKPEQRHIVLIVDDEPALRALLGEYLRDCGFFTLLAGNAAEAIELVKARVAIDIIFSDVRMPGELDGYGLARWVMENRPDIPLILATGDLGKANAAAQLCSVETVTKPYDFQEMPKSIRRAIEKHRMKKAN